MIKTGEKRRKVRCLVCGKKPKQVSMGTDEALIKCSCGAVCSIIFENKDLKVEFEDSKEANLLY